MAEVPLAEFCVAVALLMAALIWLKSAWYVTAHSCTASAGPLAVMGKAVPVESAYCEVQRTMFVELVVDPATVDETVTV